MKLKKVIISAIGAILCVLIITSFYPLYTLRSFHCDFTGSMKSWTEWPFGLKSKFQYETSPLEAYIVSNHPEKIEHKWVSYQGTGKNLIGMVVIRGHGRPNSLLTVRDGVLKDWIQYSQDPEIMELYQTLLSDDPEEIRSRIDLLHNEWFKLMEQGAEPIEGGQ